MINNITQEIIWNGRETGGTWFHPRAALLPDGRVLMTCQHITGSDNFGTVHWCITEDNGKNWSNPQPISAFQRRLLGSGFEEGVCDVVPEYHAPSGKVLLMGHNVFYHNDVLYTGIPEHQNARHAVYCVGDSDGNWGTRHELIWDEAHAGYAYYCGCAQRFTFENGDILVPLYFAPRDAVARSVTTVRYGFDGEKLTLKETGRELCLDVKRGLLEPSVVKFNGIFYLTIRAEDGHGYLATARDGLNWCDIIPWKFDDGEALEMSTTQQRWMARRDGLYLVYTRKAANNTAVMRWRSPLFVAQMDMSGKCLIRETEQIIFPLEGDGNDPNNRVSRLGNFHVVNISPEESWITVGEGRPQNGWNGNTLLARVN